MKSSACVRSGHCCKVATCTAGLMHGASPRGCEFLRGDTPGEYECELAATRPDLREVMTIGAGCSSTMFNKDRDLVLKGLAKL